MTITTQAPGAELLRYCRHSSLLEQEVAHAS